MPPTVSRVGPYRPLNLIRTGHACQIWEAMRDATGQRVALKLFLGEAAQDKEQIALLKQEYAVGQTLKHPNIIEFYGCEIQPTIAYLAMEYFTAPNMKQWIHPDTGVDRDAHAQKFAQLAPLAGKIIDESAQALAHVHAQGWIHRDIKADNFLVKDTGQLKLIDFALAQKKKGWFGKLLGGKSEVQGTRSYMSPEQIRGSALDVRADIYSLGCVWFEWIGGRPPFTGATTKELLNKHLTSPVPPLEAQNRNVSPELSKLIKRMLGKEPGERPASMSAVLEELKKIRVWNK